MNMGPTLAAQATLCKELGKPFVFPRSDTQWNSLTDMTEGELLAEHMLWAATPKKPAIRPTTWSRVMSLDGSGCDHPRDLRRAARQPHSEYVRGLLVEHRVLPRRDELRTRYNDWAASALDRVKNPQSRELVHRHIRWHHQRRMNQMDEVSRGTFLRSKQSVTVAVEFLNWLGERAISLAELSKPTSTPGRPREPPHAASPIAS
jgi:hypothetical protein